MLGRIRDLRKSTTVISTPLKQKILCSSNPQTNKWNWKEKMCNLNLVSIWNAICNLRQQLVWLGLSFWGLAKKCHKKSWENIISESQEFVGSLFDGFWSSSTVGHGIPSCHLGSWKMHSNFSSSIQLLSWTFFHYSTILHETLRFGKSQI